MRRNHEIGAFYPGIFRLLEDITTLKDVSQISLATKHLKFKSLLRMALKLHTTYAQTECYQHHLFNNNME